MKTIGIEPIRIITFRDTISILMLTWALPPSKPAEPTWLDFEAHKESMVFLFEYFYYQNQKYSTFHLTVMFQKFVHFHRKRLLDCLASYCNRNKEKFSMTYTNCWLFCLGILTSPSSTRSFWSPPILTSPLALWQIDKLVGRILCRWQPVYRRRARLPWPLFCVCCRWATGQCRVMSTLMIFLILRFKCLELCRFVQPPTFTCLLSRGDCFEPPTTCTFKRQSGFLR